MDDKKKTPLHQKHKALGSIFMDDRKKKTNYSTSNVFKNSTNAASSLNPTRHSSSMQVIENAYNFSDAS